MLFLIALRVEQWPGAEAEAKAVVPESVLKKRKRAEEWELARNQALDAKRKRDRLNRKLILSEPFSTPTSTRPRYWRPIKIPTFVFFGGFLMIYEVSNRVLGI